MIRFGLAVALACACGSSGVRVAPQATPDAPRGWPATRFIPAHPTYAVAAHSIRDLQQATRDLFGSLGILFDTDVSKVSTFLQSVIVVDPLAPDALGAIGVDADGGVAVFSESINPTLVVHLSSPDQLAGFFQQQRERGMKSQSIIVGDREIYSVKLLGAAPFLPEKVSWVVDGDWLWVHFSLPFDHDEPDAEWFTHSHDAGKPAWTDDWSQAATDHARLAGFFDAQAILSKLPKVGTALACAKQLEPVGHFAFSIEGDDSGKGDNVAVRLSVDTHSDFSSALLPPPEGWDAAARGAPLAVQWNLDLPTAMRWAAPCMTIAGIDPSGIGSYGVRAGRAMLLSFDADDTTGTGAVALDLSSSRFVRSQLDRIPLRSTLESAKSFGPYQGSSLSVPLGPTIEYVVTDGLAIGAVGEDVLARVIGRGPGAPTKTVAAIDVVPAGLDALSWEYVLGAAQISNTTRTVERLGRWRDLHLTLTLDSWQAGRTRLTLKARGKRK